MVTSPATLRQRMTSNAAQMTIDHTDSTPTRTNRSLLVVPACRPELFAKAALSAADAILLDLEDSVADGDKVTARANVVDAISTIDWGHKSLSLRINGLDTPFMYRDLVDVLEQSTDRLDMMMIPKVSVSADIYAVDKIVSQIELAKHRRTKLRIEAQIESAEGLTNVEAIAAASPRLASLHFGAGDFAASIGIRSETIGGPVPTYGVISGGSGNLGRTFSQGDIWHYAMSRLVVAARANGLRAVDGPYASISDQDGLLALSQSAAAQGFDGKWAIHPSQIDPVNRAFSPSDAEIAHARRVVDALANAGDSHRGAIALDGRMLDMASVRRAQTVLAIVDSSTNIGH